MPRIARVSVPGLPYHVTQRGNRKNDVFFEADDRRVYKSWLAEYAARYDLEIWAYCLMSNHVHLLVMGNRHESLAEAIGRTHGRYAQWQNRRNDWSGHFWAGRFYSTPLDERHLWAAVKYIELNPVRAGIVDKAEMYKWSSAWAHVHRAGDPLLSPAWTFSSSVDDWSKWLQSGLDDKSLDVLRRNTSTGRPTGSKNFVEELEFRLGRILQAQTPGRRPKSRKT